MDSKHWLCFLMISLLLATSGAQAQETLQPLDPSESPRETSSSTAQTDQEGTVLQVTSEEPVADASFPAYPDASSSYTITNINKRINQQFAGQFMRQGRKIYLEEQRSSSGPISYNEYFIYDYDKNKLFRFLRDERVYFESYLTVDQRLDAIRRGWIPSEGSFPRDELKVQLSSREIPLRSDTYHDTLVELLVREITAELPPEGAGEGQTIREYALVWQDPAQNLPLKVIYTKSGYVKVIVTYEKITSELSEPEVFTIPKDYLNLSPY